MYGFVFNSPLLRVDILGLWPPVIPRHNSPVEEPSTDEGTSDEDATKWGKYWDEYGRARDLLRALCDKCCECKGQNTEKKTEKAISECKSDADKIAQAIARAWKFNKRKGCSPSNGDLVYGNFCWDWEKAFFDAAKSVRSKNWCVAHGQIQKRQANPGGSTTVHYFIRIWACNANKRDECTAMIDDSWFRGGMVHERPWPDSPNWERTNWTKPSRGHTKPIVNGCPTEKECPSP